jgi:hypothetical protein
MSDRFDNQHRRPRQSGMEQEHERIVLELLNFMNGLDIPFWRDRERGAESGELSIRERLDQVKKRFADLKRQNLHLAEQARTRQGWLEWAQEVMKTSWAAAAEEKDTSKALTILAQYLLEQGFIKLPPPKESLGELMVELGLKKPEEKPG